MHPGRHAAATARPPARILPPSADAMSVPAGLTHVVGAGLAGLSCAVDLVTRGRRVILHEAAPTAGGRCRSFHDPLLGCSIDNGSHMVLSGNRATLSYLARIGAADTLAGPPDARFPFVDLNSGERWTVRVPDGRLPWWLLSSTRRVPGTRLAEYRSILRLMRAPRDATVRAAVGTGVLAARFWDPFCVAVLNAAPERAAASLLRRVMIEAFSGGGRTCRPLVARRGLSDSFVDPALSLLRESGATVHFGRRLTALDQEGGEVRALRFGEDRIALGRGDSVVLAVPQQAAAALLPGLPVPQGRAAIVNAHFRLPAPAHSAAVEYGFLGIAGGVAQWLFVRGPVVSVTVSAADGIVDQPAEVLLPRLWQDVARALGLPLHPLPPARLIKERRATFDQTPDALALRPGPRTPLRNLLLAGDWTEAGLPATIEAAIRAGRRAAALT